VIDVETVWTPQMLGYCELVSDRQRLSAAFNQSNSGVWTSVTSYGELIEQIMDDLDGLGMLDELQKSNLPSSLKDALATFVRTLDKYDSHILNDSRLDFDSAEWGEAEDAAQEALLAAENWNRN
jgi:hypothetical protein